MPREGMPTLSSFVVASLTRRYQLVPHGATVARGEFATHRATVTVRCHARSRRVSATASVSASVRGRRFPAMQDAAARGIARDTWIASAIRSTVDGLVAGCWSRLGCGKVRVTLPSRVILHRTSNRYVPTHMCTYVCTTARTYVPRDVPCIRTLLARAHALDRRYRTLGSGLGCSARARLGTGQDYGTRALASFVAEEAEEAGYVADKTHLASRSVSRVL